MGLRGPVPVPSAINKLRGNPGKRTPNKHEPQPLLKAPDCPESVKKNAVALAEWDRLVPILTRMKVLTEADYIVLESLCLLLAELAALMAALDDRRAFCLGEIRATVAKENLDWDERRIAASAESITVCPESAKGQKQKNPLMGMIQERRGQMLLFLRELGLTPSARSRVNVIGESTEKPADPWSAL